MHIDLIAQNDLHNICRVFALDLFIQFRESSDQREKRKGKPLNYS